MQKNPPTLTNKKKPQNLLDTIIKEKNPHFLE